MRKIYPWLRGVISLCLFCAALTATAQPVFTNLNFFNSTAADGGLPSGLVASGTMLFGATQQGGSANAGTLYSMDTNGANYSVLYNFTNKPDGAVPNELLLNSGTLYGTTYQGGITNNYGTIFKIGTNGTGYTLLRQFTNSPDAQQPVVGLVLGGDTLYGTSLVGGSNNGGTVFKIDTNGANYAVLRHFTNGVDGSQPRGRLLLIGASLYGTTAQGGSNGYGTVFKLNTNGAGYSVIYHFSGFPNPYTPWAGLVGGSNTLYGVTTGGGGDDSGAIFSLGTNGGNFTILRALTNNGVFNDGLSPQGPLLLNGTTLYGTALALGTGFGGTVFQLSTNGTAFTVLKNFTSASTGSNPKGQLVLAGKTIYGICSAGGPLSYGSSYRLQLTPAITLQPQGLTVTNGSAVGFIGDGDGVGALSYQWNSNNIPIAGATATNLNFASVTTNNAGSYTFVVANLYGSVTSSPAILTVSFNPLPSITAPPQSLTVTNGNPATFTVTAINGPLTYQWYFNTNTILAGQTATNLIIASVTTNNAGAYTVVISNSVGTVTSSPASLTVFTPPLPLITAQPQNLTITNGNPATFNVTATNGTLTYQWYFNTNSPLAGQTNNSYTIASATTNNAGTYTVVVVNGVGAVTSSPARLTVSSGALPLITAQPQSLNVTNGNPTTFNVTAINGPLVYQWYFNTNTILAGQTNNSFTIASTGTNNAGAYTVAVANGSGAVTSSPASLTVSTNSRPVITAQPQDLIVTNGDTATFIVAASGLGPLKYLWYTNNVNTAIGQPVPSQVNSTLSFVPTTSFNNYYFSVVISNSLGKATSSPALLRVVSGPLIISNPQPASVFVGNPASFAVGALGVNLRFQWYSNSVNTTIGTGLAGQTNSTYVFTSGTNHNGRYYSVVVTNTLGRATSSPALLIVNSLLITQQPSNAVITNGSLVSFTSAASGAGPLGYQWLFNTNTLIPGATATNLVLTNANQPGAYSMKVTNSSGAATSSPAILTVVAKPIMLSATFDATSGSYAFSYVSLAGSTNRLWASTNLTATNFWKAIATNFMATNGTWQVTDPNAAKTNDVKFYRFSTP